MINLAKLFNTFDAHAADSTISLILKYSSTLFSQRVGSSNLTVLKIVKKTI